jgi:hypothetical protein
MEIEFESDDPDDNINDGGAVLIFTGIFLIDTDGEKWAQCVMCCRWMHENCGFEEDYFLCPVCRKSVKL